MQQTIWFNILIIAVSFFILAKSADFFVESAVGIAYRFGIPHMLVGIFVVGFATTAPEIAVSAQSAFLGHPEIAFGNALGSVIVDDGVALALAGLVAPAVILVNKAILNTSGIFLIAIDIIALVMAWGGYISRTEGMILIGLLFLYLGFVIYSEKRRKLNMIAVDEELEQHQYDSALRLAVTFLAGLAGVLLASRFLIDASVFLAHAAGISETIIGLTIIAIGTSLPEISTCIVAARKGHGELAVGDIIGADILNILWIIGVSATITPIRVAQKTVIFSFAAMFIVVGAMLVMLRIGYRLDKKRGVVLLGLYAVYLVVSIRLFFTG